MSHDGLKAAVVSRLQIVDCDGDNIALTRSQLIETLQAIDQLEKLRELLRRVVDSASGDDFGSVGATLLAEIKKELDK